MADQVGSGPKLNPLYPPHPLPQGAKPTRVAKRYLQQLSLAERDLPSRRGQAAEEEAAARRADRRGDTVFL